MIEKALKSSVIISPRFSDYRIQEILVNEAPDIEAEIEKILKKQEPTKDSKQKDPTELKKENKIDEAVTDVEKFKAGNVGDLEKFTAEQFGNVRGLATNPFQFVIGTVFRKLAKGVGAVGFALLFMEIVKFIIEQLMQPGRLLDRRFKKLIDKQILIFTERREQAELRQGFKEVRVTTIHGLRGGMGQISGNLFNPEGIQMNFLDSRKLESSIAAQNSQLKKFGTQSVGSRGPNA